MTVDNLVTDMTAEILQARKISLILTWEMHTVIDIFYKQLYW